MGLIASDSIYSAFPLKEFELEWKNSETVLSDALQGAEEGDQNAYQTLVFLYRNGYGAPVDYLAAFMWADVSARYGDEASFYKRDIIGRKLDDAQIEEARRLAQEWVRNHPFPEVR